MVMFSLMLIMGFSMLVDRALGSLLWLKKIDELVVALYEELGRGIYVLIVGGRLGDMRYENYECMGFFGILVMGVNELMEQDFRNKYSRISTTKQMQLGKRQGKWPQLYPILKTMAVEYSDASSLDRVLELIYLIFTIKMTST
jgi:hypothetical protein